MLALAGPSPAVMVIANTPRTMKINAEISHRFHRRKLKCISGWNGTRNQGRCSNSTGRRINTPYAIYRRRSREQDSIARIALGEAGEQERVTDSGTVVAMERWPLRTLLILRIGRIAVRFWLPACGNLYRITIYCRQQPQNQGVLLPVHSTSESESDSGAAVAPTSRPGLAVRRDSSPVAQILRLDPAFASSPPDSLVCVPIDVAFCIQVAVFFGPVSTL